MRKSKVAYFTALLSAIILITSCSWFNDDIQPPVYFPFPTVTATLTGDINITGAVPHELLNCANCDVQSRAAAASRSAFPSVPSTVAGYSYYATVTDTNGIKTWSGSADFTSLPAYSISGLDVDTLWQIEIGMKEDSTGNSVLKDTHTLTASTKLSAENPVYTHDFELKPMQTGGTTPGSGSIFLDIELEADSEITKCITSLSATEYNAGSNAITISTTATSGSYVVEFNFYSSASEVLYSFTEAINVFDNLETDTWVRNGGTDSSPYLVEETGVSGTVTKCKITNAMVQAFRNTTLYVKYSGGNTNGTGTFFNPLQNIPGAIAKMYDKDLDYRIIVMDSPSGTMVSIPATFTKDTIGNNHAKSLTICGYDGPDENGIPQNTIAGLGVNAQPVIITYSNVPLIFKNLKLTNGKAGIDINNYNTEVTLDDGVYITGNTVAVKGNSFSMKGSAYIASDNEVNFETELSDTFKIKIKGQLTKHSSTDKIKVKPSSYERGTVIVEADGTNVTDLSSMKELFEVVNPDIGKWYPCLSSDKSQILINTPYYVAGNYPNNGMLPSGNDSNSGAENNPFLTIDKACEAINTANTPLDYTIIISGKVAPTHILVTGSYPLTSTNATSLTLKGFRELNDSGEPLDGIDADGYATSPCLEYDCAEVPLHLQNLFIKNGTDSGIRNYNATIYIESGTVIENNTRQMSAGGVLNSAGTIYMSGGIIRKNHTTYPTVTSGGGMVTFAGTTYIYGDAVIGDKNATSYSNPADPDETSNYSENGGGLCVNNGGVVYIGYKPDGSVDENFTGGIYYNSADSQGGGIYVSGTNTAVSKIYIAGGEIAYNAAKNGAGIAASSQYAEIYISGALIKENMIAGSATGKGGAINSQGLLSLSDSAYIPGGVTNPSTNVLVKGTRYNDIYLGSSDARITIAGKLTPPDGSDGIIGSITPYAYTDGSTVVALRTSPAPSPSTTIAEASACFEVNPYVNTSVSPNITTPWYMSSTGTIMDAVPVSSLTSAPASGTKVAASSQADLTTISGWVNSSSDGLAGVTVKLLSNITLDSTWAGIGRENTYSPPSFNGKYFCGDFDGNNKEITFDSATKPLFFHLKDSNVQNVVLKGSIESATIQGALANTATVSSGVNKSISNVVSYCNVSNTNLPDYGKGVGGIIGTASSYNTVGVIYERNLSIVDCINYGNVSGGRYAGGIVGQSEMATLRNCECHGNVTATSQAGGIAAYINYKDTDDKGAVIENCCVTGTIKSTGACSTYNGNGYAAGIACAGNNAGPIFCNCLFVGIIDVSEASTPMGRGISVMGISPTCLRCYYVGDEDLQSGVTTGFTRYDAIGNTEITRLSDPSDITNPMASISEYRQWELHDGVPRLVRP